MKLPLNIRRQPKPKPPVDHKAKKRAALAKREQREALTAAFEERQRLRAENAKGVWITEPDTHDKPQLSGVVCAATNPAGLPVTRWVPPTPELLLAVRLSCAYSLSRDGWGALVADAMGWAREHAALAVTGLAVAGVLRKAPDGMWWLDDRRLPPDPDIPPPAKPKPAEPVDGPSVVYVGTGRRSARWVHPMDRDGVSWI